MINQEYVDKVTHAMCMLLVELGGGCYLDNKDYLWRIIDNKEVGKPSIQMPDFHWEWCENLTEDELRNAINVNSNNKKKFSEGNNPKVIPKRYIINKDKLAIHISDKGLNNLYKISNIAWQNLYWINEVTDYSKYWANIKGKNKSRTQHFEEGLYSVNEQCRQHQDILKAIRYGLKEGFISYID